MAYAKKFGKQKEVKEGLMSAYFEKGIDLTKMTNLIAIAAEHGLDADHAKEFLDSELLSKKVREGVEQLKIIRARDSITFLYY
ncbi:MAG: DsbA family protein [Cyclobacteriaceae bacterium]